MRDEVAGRPASDDGDLVSWSADRGQRFHQLQFAAFVGAVKDLDRCGGWRVLASTWLADLDRCRTGSVELALQRLRGIDIDLALGAGRAVRRHAGNRERNEHVQTCGARPASKALFRNLIAFLIRPEMAGGAEPQKHSASS